MADRRVSGSKDGMNEAVKDSSSPDPFRDASRTQSRGVHHHLSVHIGEDPASPARDGGESPEVTSASMHSHHHHFDSISKAGVWGDAMSPIGKWMRTNARASSSGAAKRAREAARLKALQRTPYPMVLARIKVLLDRVQVLKQPLRSPSTISRSPSRMLRGTATMRTEPSILSFKSSSMQLDGDPNDPANLLEAPPASKLSIDKIMEELGVTFTYVSEFLRKVPEETRLASVLWAHMENYKKDQTVYMTGDEPDKFYIILTGQVEVWTHPPGNLRERSVIATLKRGQSFGDAAILNGESRSDCVTPSSNCTFLTVDRAAFMEIFGAYFREKLQQAQEFFTSHVDLFKKVSPEEALAVVRHMLLSSYPAGREWDPMTDQQIYFIKEGCCTMESHDRKFQCDSTHGGLLAFRGEDADTPAMAESGVLANVMLRGGRAVGTLGHEEELRRMRRALIPKKVIATLEPGSHFGGGQGVLGEGDLQTSLKVVADKEVEAYHLHSQLFFRHASPALLAALRDDAAFRLTYYYGRVGSIGADVVVGHQAALLSVTAMGGGPPMRVTREGLPEGGATSPTPGDGAKGAAASGPGAGGPMVVQHRSRRRKAQKHQHEPGRYHPEVQKAIDYINDLRSQLGAIAAGIDPKDVKAGRIGGGPAGALVLPGHLDFLVQKGALPAEMFHALSSVSSSARSNSLAPLLAQVFPEGLGPLSEKIDELIERTINRSEEIASSLPASPASPGAYSYHSQSGSYPWSSPSPTASPPTDYNGHNDHLNRPSGMQPLSVPSPTGRSVGAGGGGVSPLGGSQVERLRYLSRMARPTEGFNFDAWAMAAVGSPGSSREGTPGAGAAAAAAWESPRQAAGAASGGGPQLLTSMYPGERGSEGGGSPERAGTAPAGAGARSGARPAWLQLPGSGSGSSGYSPSGYTPGSASYSPAHAHSQQQQQQQQRPYRVSKSYQQQGGGSLSGSPVASPGGYSYASYSSPRFGGAAAGGSGSGGLGSPAARGGGGSGGARHPVGALAAAGVLWERSQEISSTPSLRQCLTYEEIARLRAEERKPLSPATLQHQQQQAASAAAAAAMAAMELEEQAAAAAKTAAAAKAAAL